MTSGADQHGAPEARNVGSQRLEIANGIARLYKEHYGKGPTATRTTISANHILCVSEGALTRAERTLTAHGQEAAVAHHRDNLKRVLHDRLVTVVQDCLGQPVRSLMSTSDPMADLQCEVFVLEEAAPREADHSS